MPIRLYCNILNSCFGGYCLFPLFSVMNVGIFSLEMGPLHLSVGLGQMKYDPYVIGKCTLGSLAQLVPGKLLTRFVAPSLLLVFCSTLC